MVPALVSVLAAAALTVPALPTGTDVDYQLGGNADLPDNVGIVVRDRTAAGAGRYNVCYVNGFQTQPDEAVLGTAPGLLLRDATAARRGRGVGRVAARRPDAGQAEGLARIVGRWSAGCARDGFDAVEYDNLDSFTRSHGLVERRQRGPFARLLVAQAHDAGLAAGQKNLPSFDGTPDRLRLRRRRGVRAVRRVRRLRRPLRRPGARRSSTAPQDFAKTCASYGPTRWPWCCRDLDLSRPACAGGAETGQPLHTTELGESGSRVVFCHGLFGQGKNWTADRQGAGGPAPGHCSSTCQTTGARRGATTSTTSTSADQVAELLSADDPVALVGHSMGGKIAMWSRCATPSWSSGWPWWTWRRCRTTRHRVRRLHRRHARRRPGRPPAAVAGRRGVGARRCRTRRCAASCCRTCAARARDDGWRWQLNLTLLGDDLDASPAGRRSGWPRRRRTTARCCGWAAPTRTTSRDDYAGAMDRWFPRNRRVTDQGRRPLGALASSRRCSSRCCGGSSRGTSGTSL